MDAMACGIVPEMTCRVPNEKPLGQAKGREETGIRETMLIGPNAYWGTGGAADPAERCDCPTVRLGSSWLAASP